MAIDERWRERDVVFMKRLSIDDRLAKQMLNLALEWGIRTKKTRK